MLVSVHCWLLLLLLLLSKASLIFKSKGLHTIFPIGPKPWKKAPTSLSAICLKNFPGLVRKPGPFVPSGFLNPLLIH